ncbi:flagellar hook-associated protein 1 FlgK [Yoonia maritima]|uniref:Flagellar hook-associated protein 1 n=1 Tax=Yoonia maritima TaxID=1435347 RepID=A0A2T0VZ27_9RHOB|nr:flagellar hook-associated protein FlgK [Yoonia maritima]PRY77624.1 flagellar hook-associated protein 1 FlgK [Yoonia maritima]
MSLTSALNNAISGLTSTSRMAEVISSNLSNALTDGYGKRAVELSSVQVGNVGGGVQVVSINRFVDAGILADRRLADAALSGQQDTVNTLTRLEQSIGGIGDAHGLSAKLATFENALISAATDPASETRLTAVFSGLEGVTETLQSNTRDVQALRQEADQAIANDVQNLNMALKQVENLNKDILRMQGSGNDVSALLDARQTAVDEISAIVPVRQIDRENGTIGLMTTTGTTLLDGQAVEFGFSATPTITADMTFSSGALGGIMLNGAPIDSDSGIGRLDGGSLGAAFTMRDDTLVAVQQSLDEIAVDLIARFEDSSTDPTLTAGDMGLLTDEGRALDLGDIPGLAGRISVNALVDPNKGGDLRLLRDGINSVTAGPSGNAAQLNSWLDALDIARADAPGGVSLSAIGRVANFTDEVGSVRLNAEEQLSFTAARWDTLREAELANGVDTDIELQTLMRVEQAYAANAKVLEAADFMMQRLMEI